MSNITEMRRTEYKVNYGKQSLVFHLPKDYSLDIVSPKEMEQSFMEEDEIILEALGNPIGTKRLHDLVKPEEKVAIITSDITRPCPSNKLLPFVLKELTTAGVRKENITIVFALGIHRCHTEEEKRKLVGEMVYSDYTCIDSDSSDVIRWGFTSRGTPVDVFREVAQADFRICLGNIEHHYFAGYSGGAKAIMPGVSSKEAVKNNHSMMVLDGAGIGKILGNPVRADIDEFGRIVGVDFILNVVLNEKKEIVKAVAGHYLEAHRAGCEFVDQRNLVPISALADIVIASPGGHPKDINLYQAQKGLENAQYAVKPGGKIILVAECSEGFGEDVFEEWICSSEYTPEGLVRRIKENFTLGGHKAAAIAKIMCRNEIYLVSSLSRSITERCHFTYADSIEQALDRIRHTEPEYKRITFMKLANSTIPKYKS